MPGWSARMGRRAGGKSFDARRTKPLHQLDDADDLYTFLLPGRFAGCRAKQALSRSELRRGELALEPDPRVKHPLFHGRDLLVPAPSPGITCWSLPRARSNPEPPEAHAR